MRQRKENRGGPRDGAGRPAGPQPHLRSKNPRTYRVMVNLTEKEGARLDSLCERKGKSLAAALLELAKKGGL